ncbi:hypothetical protein PSACC_01075 [Paramicrosporidium saccamoebae]|uniref:Uncharacterized protein n=1 Tax=Paramicrosporidium saccamoebae TaxID=1246581 RepID=A0A2H9TMX7_9FUNG|nr:hypothetical protein PSACC_01075 [Paramicrosporidium saccamoebae]
MHLLPILLSLLWLVPHIQAITIVANSLENIILDHTQEDLFTMFGTIQAHPDSLSILTKLLVNKHVNLRNLYCYSCRNWSFSKLSAITAWSLKLDDKMIRNVFLDNECISRTQFSKLARKRLLELGIPSVVPQDLSELEDHEWSPVLQTGDPSYFDMWCLHIPAKLLTDQLFQAIDLSLIVTLPCLIYGHPNNELITDALIKQIPLAAETSIVRLLDVLYNSTRAFDGYRRIMAELHQRYCLGNVTSSIGQLLRIRLKCQKFDLPSFHSQMILILQNPLWPANTVAILLNMWMAMAPANLIMKALRLQLANVSIGSASSRDTILPILKRAFTSRSQSEGRAMLELVGLDYDQQVLLLPERFWVSWADQLNLPFSSKKEYYRSRKLVPLTYSDLAVLGIASVPPSQSQHILFTLIVAKVRAIISKKSDFGAIDSRVFSTTPLITPHLGAPFNELLSLLLYSFVRFDQLPAKFSRHYCLALKGDPEHLGRYLNSEFQRLGSTGRITNFFPDQYLKRHSEFLTTGQALLNIVTRKMAALMERRGLEHMFRGMTLCELLSD